MLANTKDLIKDCGANLRDVYVIERSGADMTDECTLVPIFTQASQLLFSASWSVNQQVKIVE